jgi:uncharacterized membrane protein YadS
MITRARGADESGKRPPLLPWFAVGFFILAAVNSTGWIPLLVQDAANDLSRWCLVVAMCAIGMKTQLKQIVAVGIKPVILMVAETIFLAVLVLYLSRVLN